MSFFLNGAAFDPSGVNCAMVTPFDDAGGVDMKQVGKIVDFLAQKGVHGVFPVSNVGEFLLLEQRQRMELIAAVTEKADGRLKVMPGVTDLHPGRCLELARFSHEQGADAVVMAAPYYYPYPHSHLMTAIERLADASPLPVVLYNSPSFSRPLELDSLVALCAHPNIAAVKESSGDIKFLLALQRRLADEAVDIKILLGWEELFLSGLVLGACGCMVCSACIVPEILLKLLEAFRRGDMETALTCQRAVGEITAELGKLGFPHGYKLGVLARGFDFRLFAGRESALEEEALLAWLPWIRDFLDSRLQLTKDL